MNEAVRVMLDRYSCRSIDDYKNALKEIIQEIALCGLWRSKFFEKSAFYGGSALRILYGLDRFSEDLDFSLLRKNKNFSLTPYCKALEEELKAFGFLVEVNKKKKDKKTNIDSAFIKGGTLSNMLNIDMPEAARKKMHPGKSLKIKLEVDIDPPGGFHTEAKYLLQPIPFSVNTYNISSLFAGKMHAVLCRAWKERVKGRDWYDLVWYAAKGYPVDLGHLEKRMRQTGHYKERISLTEDKLKRLLTQKIKKVDFNKAKQDVEHLLKDRASVDVWSEDFFIIVCEKIKTK